jgi:phosphonatase-like hydrolase
MAIELVVFDMAGTTVEDPGFVNRCFRETLSAHGLAVEPEEVDAVMGLPKPEAVRLLVGRSPRADELLGRVDALHADFVARMTRFYADDPAVRAVPGVDGLFARLRSAGLRVGLDTGFSRDIVDVILNRLGWAAGPDGRAAVDATVASDEVPRGRPHPDMVKHLMARVGVSEPKSVVKVGDAPADLEEGFAAGCRWVVGVTWGTHTRAQLERYAHTHLVDTVDELAALLRAGAPH